LPCEIPPVYIQLSSHSVVFAILFAGVILKGIKSKLIIACLAVSAGVFCLIVSGVLMDRSETRPAQNSTASRVATSGNSSNRPLTDEDRAARARYWHERLGAELDLDECVVQGDERMEYFCKLLRSKDTARILTFMREQRITAGDPLHFGITAIMYSSFYNDANTTEELIYHGADINRTDDFSHSALCYRK